MLKKSILVLAVLSFFAIMAMSAEKSPDFSGAWKLDKEKTDLTDNRLYMERISVTQKGDSLLTERTYTNGYGEEYPFKENLTLDGKEHKIVIYDMPRKATANRSKDGKNITINSTVTFYGDTGDVDLNTIETWSIDENGALKIDATSSSPRGETKAVFYYTK